MKNNIIKLDDKTIIQKTFLWMRWKIIFEFKENWINYTYNDKIEKINMYIPYYSIDIPDKPAEYKDHSLYYLVVWWTFILTSVIFYLHLIFWIVLLYLYLKSKKDYITLSSWYWWLIINNDKKKDIVLAEIKNRLDFINKKEILIVNKYSTKTLEKERFEKLLKNWDITQDEYNFIMLEVEDLKDYSKPKYEKDEYDEIIWKLLKEKWFRNDFIIKNRKNENKYIPGWYNSMSWEISFDNGDKYNFWFDWDKNLIDPEVNQFWYYTLWDSKDIIENYWRSFFYKI